MWWMEADNAAAMASAIAKDTPFPWNWVVPRQMRADAETRVAHLKRPEAGTSEYTHEVRASGRGPYGSPGSLARAFCMVLTHHSACGERSAGCDGRTGVPDRSTMLRSPVGQARQEQLLFWCQVRVARGAETSDDALTTTWALHGCVRMMLSGVVRTVGAVRAPCVAGALNAEQPHHSGRGGVRPPRGALLRPAAHRAPARHPCK